MRLMPNALAITISQALDDQHLSIREGAQRCGIGLGLMSAILYGKSQRPKPETLEALARGLGKSYRELALAAYGVVPTESVPA
jgi:transcriptional regulator with XRE-family HTH domain